VVRRSVISQRVPRKTIPDDNFAVYPTGGKVVPLAVESECGGMAGSYDRQSLCMEQKG